MPISEKIQDKLRDLPDKPGCYLMRDRRGQIIYVGKAVSLRKRVSSYFRQSTMRRAPPKLRGLLRSIVDFDYMVLPSEEAATLMEGRMIKDYRPRYNTLFKDDKRFPLLRIDMRHAFPFFRLCRIQRNDGAEYFGPYGSSAAVYVAREFLERHFGLRRCTVAEPGPRDHRHCLNDIIRFCSAPCMGRITEAEYRRRVLEACAFLRGERPELLQVMRQAMQQAAQALDFEKAAAWRDMLELLGQAVRRRRRVAVTVNRPDPAPAGLESLRRLLELPTPPRVIEAYDISNISGTHAVGSMVVAMDGVPRPARYRRFRIRTVQEVNDAAMLAEVVRRRFTRLLADQAALPDLLLIDGGLVQLRAAQAELARLHLAHLPAVGLAKRFEEIHLDGPHGARVLRLPEDAPGLLILRRLRDEAHRFALDYHRRLRERRIRDSRLDDIPGIGPHRKQLLINTFGSWTRIRRASVEELAAVPGISPEQARKLHAVLVKWS
ncbi:MAG: helix-hairpin-helix domain-containing protein [Kiritimatiellia bacterium]|nr:excinuclease ABC subunit UvrC [Lentisphaerota bacterium]